MLPILILIVFIVTKGIVTFSEDAMFLNEKDVTKQSRVRLFMLNLNKSNNTL